MYIPKYFQVNDAKEIWDFVQAHSFGTMVSVDAGKPLATHIPFTIRKDGEDTFLLGHVAYGNHQWRTLESCPQVLVIFQGPHAYVSSSWYSHENVPTWNYQAVHMYGKATIMANDELTQHLIPLLEKYEKGRENPVLWDTLSTELLKQELKGIIGFKVKVEEIQAAYKLSQNRNEVDYWNIIEQLKKESDPLSLQVAEAMEKRVLRSCPSMPK